MRQMAKVIVPLEARQTHEPIAMKIKTSKRLTVLISLKYTKENHDEQNYQLMLLLLLFANTN